MANAFVRTAVQTTLAIGIPVALAHLVHALPLLPVKEYIGESLSYRDYVRLYNRGARRFYLQRAARGGSIWIVVKYGIVHVAQWKGYDSFVYIQLGVPSFLQRLYSYEHEEMLEDRITQLLSRVPGREMITYLELRNRLGWVG
jgi:hypothetical protein